MANGRSALISAPPSGEVAYRLEKLIRTKKATIGVIGLGYVGLPLVRLFASKGFPVLGFDIDLPPMRHYKHLKVKTVALTEKALRESDAAVIVTDHSSYDYAWIVRHAPMVVDTRNASARVREGKPKVVKA